MDLAGCETKRVRGGLFFHVRDLLGYTLVMVVKTSQWVSGIFGFYSEKTLLRLNVLYIL
jgi:hypothetical protein